MNNANFNQQRSTEKHFSKHWLKIKQAIEEAEEADEEEIKQEKKKRSAEAGKKKEQSSGDAIPATFTLVTFHAKNMQKNKTTKKE
jgi:hypothetical protein